MLSVCACRTAEGKRTSTAAAARQPVRRAGKGNGDERPRCSNRPANAMFGDQADRNITAWPCIAAATFNWPDRQPAGQQRLERMALPLAGKQLRSCPSR
jgi:hypothetical protein